VSKTAVCLRTANCRIYASAYIPAAGFRRNMRRPPQPRDCKHSPCLAFNLS